MSKDYRFMVRTDSEEDLNKIEELYGPRAVIVRELIKGLVNGQVKFVGQPSNPQAYKLYEENRCD